MRIDPIRPGDSRDEEVNDVLHEAVDGWWGGTRRCLA